MRKAAVLVVLGCFLGFGSLAYAGKKKASPPPPAAEPDAAPAPTDEEQEAAAIAKEQADFEAKLTFRTGTIPLVGGKVELALPEGYRYLDPEDTEKILVEWGNLPGEKTAGLILPKGSGLWEVGSLAIVVEYADDGHVSDDDAAKIDYDKLLGQMRDDSRADNEKRKAKGLASGDLLGWAEPPRYDKATHKLYWALEYDFGNSDDHQLNYKVRVLGREGILELNALGGMSQLGQTKEEMQRVLGFSNFTRGNLYTDYKKGSDRAAGYGIAALVAGGIAAKAIGAKGFLALLLGAKKLIVLLFAGIAAGAKKLKDFLGGRRAKRESEQDPAEPTA